LAVAARRIAIQTLVCVTFWHTLTILRDQAKAAAINFNFTIPVVAGFILVAAHPVATHAAVASTPTGEAVSRVVHNVFALPITFHLSCINTLTVRITSLAGSAIAALASSVNSVTSLARTARSFTPAVRRIASLTLVCVTLLWYTLTILRDQTKAATINGDTIAIVVAGFINITVPALAIAAAGLAGTTTGIAARFRARDGNAITIVVAGLACAAITTDAIVTDLAIAATRSFAFASCRVASLALPRIATIYTFATAADFSYRAACPAASTGTTQTGLTSSTNCLTVATVHIVSPEIDTRSATATQPRVTRRLVTSTASDRVSLRVDASPRAAGLTAGTLLFAVATGGRVIL
jgi:hypothetical protein